MIPYFQQGLCLSIKVEMEQRGRELNSFKELVKKAVNAEAKAALQLRSYTRKTDQHCLQGSRPSAAKASTQSQPMKDPRVEKPKKPQESKASALQRSDSAKTSEQARKKKKKKDKQHWGQKPQNSAPATRVNSTTTSVGHLSASGRSQPQKDLSQIICYNCNKKGHYATKCLEPPKAKI